MKKNWKKGGFGVLLLLCTMMFGITVQAKSDVTIKKGVYADCVELSGLTKEEATQAVEAYVDELAQIEITLIAADENAVIVTAGDLGISWTNPEIMEEAVFLGTQGNVIQRYKALKDLENDNYVFDLEIQYDVEAINHILTQQCAQFDREAVDYRLKKENGAFTVIEGNVGYLLDVEASIDKVYDYMMDEWKREPSTIALAITEDLPLGGIEELAVVKDVLGTFSTSYATSGSTRCANVENGSRLINGVTLYPGEEFSTLDLVTPFSEKNGYQMAASYLNGKVVDSLGGGICQVSSTLYNAVLQAELDVKERYNHSMVVAYVDRSADAAIAESSGKDFRFVNNTYYPIYIESSCKDKHVTVTVYGKEVRPENRTVRYESEILEETLPPHDEITADASKPLGYITTESAHIGYKAKLWKVVTENGVEVSREPVNSSKYKMSPRSAIVGVATDDPQKQIEIMAAIGTYNIDHVKNVIALLTAPPAE